MEITQRRTFTCGRNRILVVSISRKRLWEDVDGITGDNQIDRRDSLIISKLEQLLQKLQGEIMSSTVAGVNLEIDTLVYPLCYWEQLLSCAFLQFGRETSSKVFVTQRTTQNRQRFSQNNKALLSWQVDLLTEETPESDLTVDEDYAVKTILMTLFQMAGVSDDAEIENLLASYVSLEDLIRHLFT
ncbi:Spo16p KNAG_0E00560 [Huiozyma naganishii CBS 8797]|uniref:Uncharacterized protein n=1 Tax=Huiozyma naganishii (strain ATCC MYA-139 / BCRC 22969 / CBS 8797 / KCTC 17520 / NBRC 10181 / NCYC 3082 / Yp74L-3) TaxID=1071383 RepID=J7S6D3_HUIN7|nr:hypothetical protein KNAG_0E00560 [Kazachstania naganishii CBS 8797]CCK70324.1 hypothetical protein KNAG_0E00560 [Kazachstania naganishii CBS 8797]